MKVWVLTRGCRHEGGSVVDVFASKEAGLKAVEALMTKEKQQTAELSTADDPCETTFRGIPFKDGVYMWIEGWKCMSGGEMTHFESDYVALTEWSVRGNQV